MINFYTRKTCIIPHFQNIRQIIIFMFRIYIDIQAVKLKLQNNIS